MCPDINLLSTMLKEKSDILDETGICCNITVRGSFIKDNESGWKGAKNDVRTTT